MLTPHILKALEGLSKYRESAAYASEQGPPISVHKITGKAGAFYEKLRYLIDYREEHTIRRNAIERIVRRKLSIENGEDIGLSILQELVSTCYLPNDRVSQLAAHDVQQIVAKYKVLGLESGVGMGKATSLMASEIERFLYPQLVDELVVEAFYKTIVEQVHYTGPITTEKLRAQTYIACRRSLLENDDETLFYALVVKYVRELPEVGKSVDEVRKLLEPFSAAVHLAEEEMENGLSWRISTRLKNYSVYFYVVREIVQKYGKGAKDIFDDPERLNEQISALMDERYGSQYQAVQKGGIRAVLYILITKITVGLAIELPYERIFLGMTDYVALGINVIFHPVLLFVMVKTARKPSGDNTKRIIGGVHNVLHDENIKPMYVKPPTTSVFLQLIFVLFYGVLFAISFGVVLWALNLLNFNIVSIVLFLLFLTLVSYFGFRLRFKARKWVVSDDSEGILSLLWNFLTLPVVRTGRWLNKRFSTVNIFVFFMDFIIETPFKFLLSTFDAFVTFLKEKREDPY